MSITEVERERELKALRAELNRAHTEQDKIREYTENLEARINFLIKEEVRTYEKDRVGNTEQNEV